MILNNAMLGFCQFLGGGGRNPSTSNTSIVKNISGDALSINSGYYQTDAGYIFLGNEDTEITADDYTIENYISISKQSDSVGFTGRYSNIFTYTIILDNTSGTSDKSYNRIGIINTMKYNSGLTNTANILMTKDECDITVPAGKSITVSYTVDISKLNS